MRTRHVLRDHAANTTEWLSPSLARRSCAANVVLRDPALRAGTGERVQVDAELLRDLARGGRGDLHGRLVRLDLHERVVLCDLLPLGDEPAGDLAFGEALAQIGQLQRVRHQPILIASSRSTAWMPLTPFTTCVTRRSTTTLASASASRRSTPSSHSIRSRIAWVAVAAAAST